MAATPVFCYLESPNFLIGILMPRSVFFAITMSLNFAAFSEALPEKMASISSRLKIEFSDSLLAEAMTNIYLGANLSRSDRTSPNYTSLLLRSPNDPHTSPIEILSKLSMISEKPYVTISLSEIGVDAGFENYLMLEKLSARIAHALSQHSGRVYIGIELPSSSVAREKMKFMLIRLGFLIQSGYLEVGSQFHNLSRSSVLLFSSMSSEESLRLNQLVRNDTAGINRLETALESLGFPRQLLYQFNEIVPLLPCQADLK